MVFDLLLDSYLSGLPFAVDESYHIPIRSKCEETQLVSKHSLQIGAPSAAERLLLLPSQRSMG